MTKREFIHALMEEYSLLKEDATKIVDIVFKQVRRELVRGREVRIDGVGSFSFKYKEPGVVNNNLLGKRHKVGPRVKLKFNAFPSMQRALNSKLAAEFNDGEG